MKVDSLQILNSGVIFKGEVELWPWSWYLLLLLERAGDLNLLSGLKALSFSLLEEGLDFLLESETNPGILASSARL